jgi:3-hydroxymyristoyl/3-hydroxydecanoyl-(acyl carrier protein) dehydratase
VGLLEMYNCGVGMKKCDYEDRKFLCRSLQAPVMPGVLIVRASKTNRGEY